MTFDAISTMLRNATYILHLLPLCGLATSALEVPT